MAKLVVLIETDTSRGAGTKENPSRFVKQWWTPEGKFVVEQDAWGDAYRAEAWRRDYAELVTLRNEVRTLREAAK